MKAKEIAKMMTDGITVTKGDPELYGGQELGVLSEEDTERFNERIYEASLILFKECAHLINAMKRPPLSAVKEINEKSNSIVARVNTIFGVKTLNTDLFIIGIMSQDEIPERRKELFKAAGNQITFTKIIDAIKEMPEYRKLIQQAVELEEHEKAVKELVPYAVIKLEELVEDPSKIVKEVLCRYMAISNYSRAGIPFEYMRPLIEETKFIEIVNILRMSGKIEFTMDLVNEFRADPMKTINKLQSMH